MKRVFRAIFALAAAFSFVLFAATLALWVRGYRVGDEMEWTRIENVGDAHYVWYLVLSSGRGGLAVRLDAEIYDRGSITAQEAARLPEQWERMLPVHNRPPRYPEPFGQRAVIARGGGFILAWHRSGDSVVRDLIVPAWAAAIATGVLPLLWVVRFSRARRRRRRAGSGYCAKCGYDLRATPDRCPECGLVKPSEGKHLHQSAKRESAPAP